MRTNRKVKTLVLFLVVLVVASMTFGSMTASAAISGLKTPSSVSTRGTGDSSDGPAGQEEAKEENAGITTGVLLEREGIKISCKGLDMTGSWYGPSIKLLVENDSTQNITVQARDVSVNGYMVENMMSIDVAAGKKANGMLTLNQEDMELADIFTIADVAFRLHVFDKESWDTIFDSDLIKLETPAAVDFEYTYDDSGIQLYDGHGIQIVAKGIAEDVSWYGPSLYVYIYNYGDVDVTVQLRDESVNGFMVNSMFSCDVGAGKHAIDAIVFSGDDLKENSIDEIENCEISFHIFDSKTWEAIVDTEMLSINF